MRDNNKEGHFALSSQGTNDAPAFVAISLKNTHVAHT